MMFPLTSLKHGLLFKEWKPDVTLNLTPQISTVDAKYRQTIEFTVPLKDKKR